jgi:hypothetical protein
LWAAHRTLKQPGDQTNHEGVERSDADEGEDRADDHEHEHADPELVAGYQGADVAHDELRPRGRSDGSGKRLGRCRYDAAACARDDHGRGLLQVRGGHEGRVEVALADIVRRFRDRRDWADVEGRAGRLHEAGAQRLRLGHRADHADLDAVRMRLVVGADDADREHNHEEQRDHHGAQREPRLRALSSPAVPTCLSFVIMGLYRGPECRRRPLAPRRR